MKEFWVDNEGVKIHVLDSIDESDEQFVPLLICPGLSEHADEYRTLIEDLLPRRSIVISFRGRGKSDTPEAGYSLQHHLSDISSVVDKLNLQSYYLLGYSRGVSYAIGHVLDAKQSVKGLILEEYPAEHKRMSPEWAEDYINGYLTPTGRIIQMRAVAVHGIQRESVQYDFWDELGKVAMPVLLMRGMLEGSLLTDEDEDRYRNNVKNLSTFHFHVSEHDVWRSEYALFVQKLKEFMSGGSF